MAKMRVYELAKELDITSKDLIAHLAGAGIEVKSASSNIDETAISIVKNQFGAKSSPAKAENKTEARTVAKAETKTAAKPQDNRPQVSDKKPAAKNEGDGKAPVKKKNITAVFNSHYSSQGRGRNRDDKKPRPQGNQENAPKRGENQNRPQDGKRSFRPEGGHTIIRPRPDSERTIRPRVREPEPVIERKPQPAPEVKAPEKTEAVVVNTETKVTETPKEVSPVKTEPVKTETVNVYEAQAQANTEKTVVAEVSERSQGKKNDKSEKKNFVKNNQGGGQPGQQKASKKDNSQGQGKGGKDKNRGKKDANREQNDGGRKKERIINLEKSAAKKRQKHQEPKTVQRGEDDILTLVLPEHLTIRELSEKMKVASSEVVKKLFMKGMMVTVNQDVTYEQAEEIALEFNCVCEPEEKVDVIAELLKEDEEDEANMVKRPPVVCVMGHVDHGKTSLLDAIRDTHMIDREAGGITQKIGAYMVSINDQKITFLDTPGHEAFTAMRMRGASSTDIAILVVAADDGVMPQTVEAINHARAAGVEIIVAINKIDKPGANLERVKKELSEHDLISEDWGGSTVFVPVSAKTREGIDELLEMVLLTAEVLELKADPKRNARGLVIEAELDKGRGVVATVLVQKGTLKVGDPIVAGKAFGKVRAMLDEHGRRIKKVGPSMPAEILGLSEVPNAGEIFMEMDSEKDARSFANTFVSVGKDKLIEDTRNKMSLDDLFSQIKAGNVKELNIIVKADVQGSVEAVRQSLEKLSNDEVAVKIIHAGVGAITESDVTLASASNAIIIGFNVRPDNVAKQSADSEGIDVRLYSVIYNIIEDIDSAMKGMLEPIYEEKVIGHAVIRQIFKASEIGNIAGSYVTDGNLVRDCKIRIRRREELIYEGALASLKRFKDNVKEVKAGFECGLVFDGFQEMEMDDEVEAYIMVEVKRH